MPSGSKDMSVECGLERENAAQVKGPKRPHSKRKRHGRALTGESPEHAQIVGSV